MNDPHVDNLTYTLETGTDFEYQAPALSVDLPGFQGQLADGVLTLTPKDHFASEEEARLAVEPYLKAWRIAAGLAHGRDDFRFLYSGAAVVDRQPVPGTGDIRLNSLLRVSGSAHIKAIRREYPSPPADFVAHPHVEALWERFVGYLEKREPLQAMAYWCLTLVQQPDPKAAAKSYNIDYAVLRKIGELASNRGDAVTGRKASAASPLTSDERTWLEAALKALIAHLAGPRLNALSMSSLPKL